MTYILIGVAITAWIAISVFALSIAIDRGGFGVFLFLLWASLSIAGVAWLSSQDKSSGPCLRYETGTQYNPATKTVMPYRRCAERGEWINEVGK